MTPTAIIIAHTAKILLTLAVLLFAGCYCERGGSIE